MKPFLLSLLICGAIGLDAVGSVVGEAFPEAFEQKPVARFLPSASEYFGPLGPAAKRLVAAERKNHRRQHFCAIGYTYGEGASNVWVHWKEAERLILWQGSADIELREKGLVSTNRDLKLGKDTVERAQDINGSTYRVTRAWWKAVADDCARHGEKITLAPFSGR